MKQHFNVARSGFTLIEILTVVSIIAVLSSVALTAVFNARIESRDKLRINTIEQLKLGFRLHKDIPGGASITFYNAGVELGVGASPSAPTTNKNIDAIVKNVLPSFKPDPLGSGTYVSGNHPYMYFYDSSYKCISNAGEKVLFVRVENTINSNFLRVCTLASAVNPSTINSTWNKNNVYVYIVP